MNLDQYPAEMRPFIEAILASPNDDSPVLIFADWLEENGWPNWGQMCRFCLLDRADDQYILSQIKDNASFAIEMSEIGLTIEYPELEGIVKLSDGLFAFVRRSGSSIRVYIDRYGDNLMRVVFRRGLIVESQVRQILQVGRPPIQVPAAGV